MASVTNSKAAFRAELVELQISDPESAFGRIGVECFADLAFVVSDAQNNVLIEKELVKPICGDNKKYATRVRRLYAHAYAISTHETERFSAGIVDPLYGSTQPNESTANMRSPFALPASGSKAITILRQSSAIASVRSCRPAT